MEGSNLLIRTVSAVTFIVAIVDVIVAVVVIIATSGAVVAYSPARDRSYIPHSSSYHGFQGRGECHI